MGFYTYCDRVGSKIFLRSTDDSGRRSKKVIDEYPFEVFIRGDGEHRSLYGESLSQVRLQSVRDLNAFVKEYADIGVYGQTDPVYQLLSKLYPDDVSFDMRHYRVFNFDIETRFDGYDDWSEVKVKSPSGKETTKRVDELRALAPGHLVWDVYNSRWYPIDDQLPHFRPGGFPDATAADYEVLSITCKLFDEKAVTFGVRDKRPTEEYYIRCDDEKDLLQKFLIHLREKDPDVLTGWNIDYFDIPYLINRVNKIWPEGVNLFSPFHRQTSTCIKERYDKEAEMDTYRILGLPSLDYMQLYKKFGAKQEQYSLNYICSRELGEEKIDYSEYGDLMGLYLNNFELFVTYNIRDVELVERLDKKLHLLQLAISLVHMTKVKFSDVYGKVKLWDCMIYNMLLKENIIIPPLRVGKDEGSIAGAWVKEPIPGKYRMVCSLDLTSLYPSICMMYNMSPETLRKEADEDPLKFMERLFEGQDLALSARQQNLSCTANGAWFDPTSSGVLPNAMRHVFDSRQKFKRLMLSKKKEKESLLATGGDSSAVDKLVDEIATYDALQGALKVLANSGYGACANVAFRYFNRNIAEGITLTGQLTIRFIVKMINRYLNDLFGTNKDYVIAADTDSAYLALDDVPSDPTDVEKSIDELSEFLDRKLRPFTQAAFGSLGAKLGARQNLMDMKKEAIASVGIWRAKKNYILLTHEMEGVRLSTPAVKTTGVEAVRGSTPMISRKALEKSYRILLEGTQEELIQYVKKFKKEFMAAPVAVRAQPIGCGFVPKSMKEATETRAPWNSLGAVRYNDLLQAKGLWKKYPMIKSGHKVKAYILKQPNPLRGNHIAFLDDLPDEFELGNYLDDEAQFKKVFKLPVESFCKVIGWNLDPKSSLMGLFA